MVACQLLAMLAFANLMVNLSRSLTVMPLQMLDGWKSLSILRQGADYCGGRINLLNTSSRIARLLQNTRHYQCFGPTVFHDEFVGCNMVFRRDVFDQVGGFVKTFTARGDDSTIQAQDSKPIPVCTGAECYCPA